jgi:hypothetical protein
MYLIFRKAILIMGVLALNLAMTSTSRGGEAVATLTAYFDLLKSGNLESAGFLWTPDVRERSSRLGISYQGAPLKVDCASPIVRNLEVMRNFLQPPVKDTKELMDGKFVRLEYSAIVGGELVNHLYYAEKDGDYYWLTAPQDMYTELWPIRETKYLRLHIDPDRMRFIHNVGFDQADKFIEKTSLALGLSRADLRHLESVKIDYFYCGSDELVTELTGHKIKGMFDMPTGDIVSSFFPHFHEIVHLLTDYKLRDIPLYVQPIIREGLAVHYGGRWGKAPESMDQLGTYLLQQDIISLDSLLSMNGFQDNASSGIAYPVAGMFAGFLLERIGQDKFLNLYRSLAADFETVYSMTIEQTQSAILAAAGGDSWQKLSAEFNEYCQNRANLNGSAQPGAMEGGKKLISNDAIIVTADDDWIGFEFLSHSDKAPTGNLLFGFDENLSEKSSMLFVEQYGTSEEFEGYRYGLRVDGNEAGLYDYGSDCLVAKFISGFSKSSDYYDSDKNAITLRLRRNVTNDLLPDKQRHRLLSQ